MLIKRTSIILITMILIVSYLIVNLRESKAVTSSGALTVIVDAGHGNPDGGTQGTKTGVLEKDLNLAIAQKVRDKLEDAGIKVIMTRTDDFGIFPKDDDTIRNKKRADLKQRVKMANESGAALMVSIHMNFFGVEKYSGPQIFYSANIEGSESIAKLIQDKFKEYIGQHCIREIKPVYKDIYLLRETKIPTVLTECGFLSNEEEERLLIDSAYQNKLAESIADGIKSYLSQ